MDTREMLRVGVISDTHGGLPREAYNALKGCDHIIHAGDVGSPSVLYKLEEISMVTAVLGNCDRADDFEDYLDKNERKIGYSAKLTLAGVKILVMHRPESLHAALAGQKPATLALGEALPQLAIHGHTHTPRKELVASTLMLCPGSPNRPRNSMPSVATLTLGTGKIISVKFVEL